MKEDDTILNFEAGVLDYFRDFVFILSPKKSCETEILKTLTNSRLLQCVSETKLAARRVKKTWREVEVFQFHNWICLENENPKQFFGNDRRFDDRNERNGDLNIQELSTCLFCFWNLKNSYELIFDITAKPVFDVKQ